MASITNGADFLNISARMEYTTLGDTGLTVTRICLGCMSFGENGEGWTIDRETSTQLVERAIELGINFFDSANVYSTGESESILGDALEGYDRDWPVVATKVHGSMDDDNPNASGLSRKAIEQELENSLDRLGIDVRIEQCSRATLRSILRSLPLLFVPAIPDRYRGRSRSYPPRRVRHRFPASLPRPFR